MTCVPIAYTGASGRAGFNWSVINAGPVVLSVRRMNPNTDIPETIRAWIGKIFANPDHRSHSWQHCYSFFQNAGQAGLSTQRDHAALHLGFYLASWGMYRGSSFLLKHSYTVHREIVDLLITPQSAPLWDNDVVLEENAQRVQAIVEVADAIKTTYHRFGKASDTLVTKILLGTTACIPACDRYFISGFRDAGFKYSSVNHQFINLVFRFCQDNEAELRSEQLRIQREHQADYPIMKLVDMYFNGRGCNIGHSF
jgi:hypothetical protein